MSKNGSKVFLSLGSNIGERKRNLEKAVNSLQQLLEDLFVSSIYETKPLYVIEQPNFLNAVVQGYTVIPPLELLEEVLMIEEQLGRDRDNSISKGPRLIDIDILLYNERIIQTDRLQIPHPGIMERQFVLIPLLELDPDIKDPRTGVRFSSMFSALDSQGVYTFSLWDYTQAH